MCLLVVDWLMMLKKNVLIHNHPATRLRKSFCTNFFPLVSDFWPAIMTNRKVNFWARISAKKKVADVESPDHEIWEKKKCRIHQYIDSTSRVLQPHHLYSISVSFFHSVEKIWTQFYFILNQFYSVKSNSFVLRRLNRHRQSLASFFGFISVELCNYDSRWWLRYCR